MKIRIEVTFADLQSMQCDSLSEFKEKFQDQIDNGVVGDDGEVGTDWMCDYEIEIVQV